VVVFRSLVQDASRRIGAGNASAQVSGAVALTHPYGVITPAQQFAMKVQRYMHDHGIRREALRAIAMASYRHAQSNPRAVMFGKPLTESAYDASRWIVEPFRLFDCCMENDGAAALVLVPAERAKDFAKKPVYLMSVAQGVDYRNAARAHNAPLYASASFSTLAPRLYNMAGVTAQDIDVVQVYENFTGGVLMALVEHGFFSPEEANDVLTLENLSAPVGRLPLNTSGGNLAECYMHGLELQIEAVRQLRGTSTAQVHDAKLGLVVAGPMVNPVSSMIVGTEDVL
jgi:acetyl-CoA acetyltransferase